MATPGSSPRLYVEMANLNGRITMCERSVQAKQTQITNLEAMRYTDSVQVIETMKKDLAELEDTLQQMRTRKEETREKIVYYEYEKVLRAKVDDRLVKGWTNIFDDYVPEGARDPARITRKDYPFES